MNESELASAIQFLDGKIKKYSAGELILLVGDEFPRAGVVLKGKIESSFQNESFDQISMHRFGSGYLFGEALVCNDIKESPVQISTVCDSVVLFVDLNRIYSDTNKSPLQFRLAENMIKSLSKKNMILNQKVRILSQKALRDRILIYLSTLKKDKDGFVKMPFTQTALAEHLGVNRSALSRELGRMQNEGLLIYNGDKIKLDL
ncbi:MAG: Crp/Fnr family transcriptional regulator [Eubacterium sp.]|nr:Crp/Fnr family transcriptional regulator [Eubacterium sp.]